MNRTIDYIVLHCTAGPQSQSVATIRAWWRKMGWQKDGYHYLIDPAGNAHNLVPIAEPSNGVKGYNSRAIHISYIGGWEAITDSQGKPINDKGRPVDNRTPEQIKTMIYLVEMFSGMFPKAIIQGHRDFSVDKNRNGIIEPSEWMKSCPSFSVAEWLREINFKSKLPVQLMTTTGVNIRTGPGLDFPLAAPTLTRGIVVRFLGEDGDWSYVSVQGDKVKGYVNKQFLKAA